MRIKVSNIALYLTLFAICIAGKLNAQFEVSSSQFMNTQFFLNPGYTGVQKALNINGTARQQWIGMEGAPKKYQIGFDSPLNNSLAGIGMGVQIEQYGPYKMNLIHANYARLIKLSSKGFLSLGFTGSVTNYSLGLGDLDLNDPNDPMFGTDISNSFTPNIGVGAFYFTQNFYFGISMPKILNEKPFAQEDGEDNPLMRYSYISTGYLHAINKNVAIKPAFLLQMKNSQFSYISAGGQVIFNNLLYLGVLYQTQKWVSALVNVQISNAINIGYSFDYGLEQEYYNNYSHEITFRYSITNLYKRNRKRDFTTKKKKRALPREESMKNLRNF